MQKHTQQRFIAALLIVLLTACQTWRPTAVSPQQLIPEEQPSTVRVTLINGETVTVENPVVRNDSIVGVTGSSVGVASRDVRSLEVRGFSLGKTIGLGVGLAALAFAVSIAILCAGDDSPYISC